MQVSAQSYKLQTSTDQVELNESMKDVIPSLDKTQLAMLGSGTIRTNAGVTDYNQYIRFNDPTTSIPSFRPIYAQNSKGKVSDYLYAAKTDAPTGALFEYELEFASGLVSKIDSGNLVDLENKEITILNKRYMFIRSPVSTTANTVTLNLIYGAVTSQMKENEEREFEIQGTKHKVKLLAVTSSKAVISIDSNTSNLELDEGETATANGVVIGVSRIVSSENPDVQDFVDIFLGAEKLTLKDVNYADTSFSKGVSLNGKSFERAHVKIEASATSSTELKISKIKYRLAVDTKDNNDLYMTRGSSLRSYMREPDAMIGSAWDISYNGLITQPISKISFDPSGNNVYKMKFTNSDGATYSFPFVSNEADTFKLGDSSSDFFFIEGSSITDYLIGQQDYFLLTNKNDETGTSNVVRYSSIDTGNSKVYFTDASGEISVSYTANSTAGVLGQGELVISGKTYLFYIQNATNNLIAMDLNGDGSINGAEVNLVGKGGAVFDLGSTNSPAASFSITYTTPSNKFNEKTGNETITINIEKRTAEVGISSISGVSTYTDGQSVYKGMALYGSLITLEDPSSGSETLTIDHPTTQTFADIDIISAPLLGIAASCSDGFQNQGETGIDCGGPCTACNLCSNGIKDLNEEGTDCGGECAAKCPEAPLPPAHVQECDGCWTFKTCVPVGTRTETEYCHENKEMKPLKQANDICYQDYQCLASSCIGGVCSSGQGGKTNVTLFNILIIILAVIAIFFVYRLPQS